MPEFIREISRGLRSWEDDGRIESIGLIGESAESTDEVVTTRESSHGNNDRLVEFGEVGEDWWDG